MPPTLEIVMPPLHAAQREVLRSPARFKVLACGRRWGKTLLGTALCTATALEGGRAWWIAPSYKMGAVGWDGLKRLGYQISGTRIHEQSRRLTYPSGGRVEQRSADDPQSLRGEGLDLAVFDEFAFTKATAWTEAVRPALADRLGRALFISTPKGHNLFWQLYQRGQALDQPDWASWSFPSTSNPYLPPGEIEEQRERTPDRIYRQEYLAEFVDDAGGVFRRVADACTAAERDSPAAGAAYAIGADWGKHNDFTVLTVIDTHSREVVQIDRFNQIDYTVQLQRLRGLYERFDARVVIAEANSMGEPLIEQLMRDGIRVQPFVTTNATKAVIIDALALAFERGDIGIIPDPVLVGELQAYAMERLPSGLMRYGAPDGMHDDCVMSLALAWQACLTGSPVWTLGDAPAARAAARLSCCGQYERDSCCGGAR